MLQTGSGKAEWGIGSKKVICFSSLFLLLFFTGGCVDKFLVPVKKGDQAKVPSCSLLQVPGPSRVVLNLTETPESSMAVTWRTEKNSGRPMVQLASDPAVSTLETNAETIQGNTEAVALGGGRTVFHHSALLDSLACDHIYAYRVGNGEFWSGWSQFKTAAGKEKPFSFVFFGDIQNSVSSLCPRLFRAAYKKAPDADFWLFIGDLVDDGGNDREWKALFHALYPFTRMVPSVLVPGNHEYPDKRVVKKENYKLFHLWRPHFTLPENGPEGLEETVYWLDYRQVRLVMLNGNERLKDQSLWMKTKLPLLQQPWTIAAVHQPVYSTGRRRSDVQRKKHLVPVFDDLGVDLVLQGHDHTYSRSFPLINNGKTGEKNRGTVYLTSVAGPKHYPVNFRYDPIMAKLDRGRQLFQVITVNGGTLTCRVYTADGVVYDSFSITRHLDDNS